MGFGDSKFDIAVKDSRNLEAITSGCYVFVYQAGTKTLATLYKSASRSALANPITRAQFALDGGLAFYTAEASVDILVNDDKGNIAFVPGMAPTDHAIMLDRTGIDKCLIAPFVFNAGGTEVDTGIDFPLNVVVKPILVEVVTADATETLNVGILSSETGGDADGLAVGVSLANAGFIRPWIATDGTTEDFIATPTTGALIGLGSAGTDGANDFGQPGGWGHVVSGSNGRSLSYTPSTSDTAAGYIYAPFKHLR